MGYVISMITNTKKGQTMKIKITHKNADKINAAIEAVEGKRVSQRRCTCNDVIKAVDRIEKRLSGLLKKKDWTGLKFHCDPNAQRFPSCYNGRPQSTQFLIERCASGWFLTGVNRMDCRSPSHKITTLNMVTRVQEMVEYVCENF